MPILTRVESARSAILRSAFSEARAALTSATPNMVLRAMLDKCADAFIDTCPSSDYAQSIYAEARAALAPPAGGEVADYDAHRLAHRLTGGAPPKNERGGGEKVEAIKALRGKYRDVIGPVEDETTLSDAAMELATVCEWYEDAANGRDEEDRERMYPRFLKALADFRAAKGRGDKS